MKKILIAIGLFLFGSLFSIAHAISFDLDMEPVSIKHFWEKNGVYEEKVLDVGSKVINANKLPKRIPIMVARKHSVVNACSSKTNKVVTVYTGILPYFDNDDELAFVVSHEIAHSLDAYDGIGRWAAMIFNSQQYEYKADLIGIDLMTKAGYNPVASIIVMNKFFPEDAFNLGIFTSHPRTSKRMMAAYKYIYKKYPSYLNSDMVKNINYVNFTYSSEKEINAFKQREEERSIKRGDKYSL